MRGKKSYVTCGAAAVMNEVCGILRCSVTEFYDFEENPKIEDVRKGLSLLVSSNSSLIVGIGGGSVLDMSKLLRFFYSYSGEATGCKFLKEKELLPLIALPRQRVRVVKLLIFQYCIKIKSNILWNIQTSFLM